MGRYAADVRIRIEGMEGDTEDDVFERLSAAFPERCEKLEYDMYLQREGEEEGKTYSGRRVPDGIQQFFDEWCRMAEQALEDSPDWGKIRVEHPDGRVELWSNPVLLDLNVSKLSE